MDGTSLGARRMGGRIELDQETFNSLLSRRGGLQHPWSSAAPAPEGTIGFGAGVPDPETLPLEQLSEAAQAVIVEEGIASLQYGSSMGDIVLREQIAERVMRLHGIETPPEHVVITTGASQALDIVCATFVDPGDVVITENPTFTGSLWTFRAHGARLVPVSSGPNGLDIDELEQTLSDLRAAGDRPKLIYLTPDYQNPTGVQMPTMLRRRLVELAASAGCLVVEDAAYAEVDIDGIAAPSLLSLAPEQTVQVGTFSKVIGPGLRIGWLTGSAPAVQQAAANRTDMGTSVTLSRMLARFLANDELDPHLSQVREVYRRKRVAFGLAARENLGPLARWTNPAGGFFFWLEATEGVDVTRLWELAREERVSFAPGFRFFVGDEPPTQFMRFAFSEVSIDNIGEGLRRLGRAVERLQDESQSRLF